MTDRRRGATTPPPPSRRHALRLLAAGALSARAAATLAQPPEVLAARPSTLWVPWPPGGGTDLTMRLLAELAGRHLHQKVQVENKPGAGGTLAMPILQQAAPDGHTIAQLPLPALRAPFTQKVLWDPIRDTTPIIQVSGVTFGIVVAEASPFRRLEDLFIWAKAHPGRLTVSTNGVGTTPHIVMDELMGRRGLKYIHVPYKGTSEQMLNVVSGHVMVGVNSTGFAPYVDSNQLRLIVTFGDKRTKRWPQVPTLKELGYDIVAQSPYGIVGPKGMPREIVMTLHDAFKAAMFDPQHVAELAKYDQELTYLGPDDYARALRAAYAEEKKVVERLGLARPKE